MKMRNLAAGAAVCLAAAWGAPAMANDNTLQDSFYLNGFGGVSFGEELDFSLEDGPDIGTAGLDQGFAVGGGLGKSWSVSSMMSVRTEFEVSYRSLNTDQDDVNIDTSTGDPDLDALAETIEAAMDPTILDPGSTNDVDVDSWGVMGNLWLDFDLGFSVVPYIGGGIGAGFVDIENVIGETHDSGAGFAWQGGAGFYTKIAQNFAIGVHYRYFNADTDITFKNELPFVPDTEVATQLTSHEISAGVTLFF